MIIITMGDPNGIGPELICRVFEKRHFSTQRFLIIGPETPLRYYCKRFSIERFWENIEKLDDIDKDRNIFLYSRELDDFSFTPGTPSTDAGKVSGNILKVACDFLKKGVSHKVVTCPINKETLIKGGFHFPGHTEFFAKEFGLGADDVCMHLYGERLKVSLVTTHPPLKDVPRLISEEKILKCLELTFDMLRKLGKDTKPIGVCGLNPHAGEEGKIGLEEIKIISPAIEKAKAKGLRVEGPYPADSLFYRAYMGEFSAVLAMYHDQGLGPLKLVHFNESVNITLGLPIVRTSVDHGTAYHLVGKRVAKTSSLIKAIEMAICLKNH